MGTAAESPRSTLERYGVAVAAVALGTTARLLLDPVLGDLYPFATLFLAVLAVAASAGFGPAVAATGLGAVAATLFLLPPRGEVALGGVENRAGLLLFLVVGGGIAALGGRMRTTRVRAVAQREELRTTLASIGDAVVVTDAAGRVVSLNPVAETLTGWTTADAAGQPLAAVFVIVNEHTRAPVENPVERVLREGVVVGLANHTVLLARAGGERPIEDSAAPVRDAGGRVTGVVLVFRDVSDRRATEARAQEHAGVLAGILAATVDHVYVVARDGRYRHVSAGGARVLGFEPHELAGKHWRELGLPTELMQRFDGLRDRVLQTGAPLTEETDFRAPDGRDHFFEYVVSPLPGPAGGEADAVVVVSRDVTERRAAERAVREAEARLAAVVDNSPAVIFLKDRDGRYLLANRRCVELAAAGGITVPLLGRSDAELVPPAVAEAFRRDDRAVMASKQPRVYEEVVEFGGVVHTSLTTKFPLLDAAGEAYAVGGISLDITDRVQTEDALRGSEERFRGLMEQAPFSVQLLAADGRTTRVNRAWEALWGVTLEQLGDYNVLEDPQLEAKGIAPYLRRAFAGEAVAIPAIEYDPNQSIPDRTRHADPRRWVSAVAYPLKDAGGAVREVVLVHEDMTARVRAEEALREREATLRAFYDHSPVCMGVTEPTADGDVLHVYDNPASCRFFGAAPGSTAGRRALADLGATPGVVALWRDRYRESEATGRPVSFEHQFHTPAGPRWLSATVCAIGPVPGGRTRFCYVAEDVTDRRAGQEELRQGEERLRLALEAGRMGVWDWNVVTNEIRWSDNLEPIHGYAPGRFGGTMAAFQELIHPADRERVNAAIARSLAELTSYDVEFRIVWPDGSVHWMAGKGKVFGEAGRPVRMVGVGMDVTARKRAEQDARFLADASAALAGLVDPDSTLRTVARLAVPAFADWAAVDMLDDVGGLRRVAVAHVDPQKVELAHDIHRRWPPDPETSGVWRIIRTGASEMVADITDDTLVASIPDPELLAIMRDLGLRSYIGIPLAVRGKVLGAVTFIAAESGRRYDATDLAVAEDLAHRAAVAIENARLYQAVREADRRKDEFLALLGHELRNPLAPVRNALHVLKMPAATEAIVTRAREMMERQVEHMVRLVDDLLDVSRIVRGKVDIRRGPVDLAAVVARAVEAAQPAVDAERHTLAVEVSPDPLTVHGDAVRLAQVVSNLLTNAAKYTEPGGRVTLTAGREGPEAVVRVRDTGIGIPPELLPRLFDMFFQAERRTKDAQGGLGIGLSIVKGLVELHGGSVEAHSGGRGTGSEFVVRLPLASRSGGVGGEDARRAAEPPPSPLFPPPLRRVLVVDDNVDAADSLAMLLRLAGQEVGVAYDGAAALAAAERDPPAVAFLDLGMPKMDGYELARRFRESPPLRGVRLVALTGWGQPEDRARTAAAGFDHHIVKPVDTADLHALLAGLAPTGESV